MEVTTKKETCEVKSGTFIQYSESDIKKLILADIKNNGYSPIGDVHFVCDFKFTLIDYRSPYSKIDNYLKGAECEVSKSDG